MSAILAELEETMRQKGRTPYTFDLRGDEVYVRHIVSGGIDNPVYGYVRAGTVDEVRQKLQALPKREPPTPGICPRCQWYSSNLTIHRCELTTDY